MLALSEDPTLGLKAVWLLRHRPESAVFIAASHSTDTMFELLRLGRSATGTELHHGQRMAPLPIAVLHHHAHVAEYLCSREDVRADEFSLSKTLFFFCLFEALRLLGGRAVAARPGCKRECKCGRQLPGSKCFAYSNPSWEWCSCPVALVAWC
ncbi:hypothetical protein DUNSADRAFT_2870 [Dunaliella salina]|uniref:Uncharacterized protein n=1 Tax=Dunaliella salina TaxID=3046 RepID=A0ABQ7FWC0_DUNSA|nr:hypothetical protein DUNSADRAFT_2870 [Dunaliella salina]|eukprot:KAF5826512.1 hypothetical protein DUNSADRAFT_2870 [Dunaliella salina]